MPKAETLRRIDAPAPVGAVVVGGGFMPSATGRTLTGLADGDGNLAQPDAFGRVTLRPGSGIAATATGADVTLAVDGSVPRTAFTGRMVIGPGTTLAADLPAGAAQLFLTANLLAENQAVLLQARGVWEYLLVTSAGVSDNGAWRYDVARAYASPGPYDWRAGDVVVKLGAAGDVALELAGASTLEGVAGPSVVIRRATGADPDLWTPVALFGNLRGRYGLPNTDEWGIGAGRYDWLGNGWFTAAGSSGLRIGASNQLLAEWTPAGDIKQYTGGVQRSWLKADGSGWFVAPETLAWDTAGNLTLAAAVRALSLRIGEEAGPRIEGGEVVDFDAAGNPIVTEVKRWGLRLFDERNKAQIALLTGTVEHPTSPALLVGADGSEHYWRWINGRQLVKGEIIIVEGGAVGTMNVLSDRWKSANGRVQLISEAAEDFAEGLILTADRPETTGALRWVLPAAPTWNVGVAYTAFDPDFGGYVMRFHVSTPQGVTQHTKIVFVAGGWGSENRTLEYNSDGELIGAERLHTRALQAAEEPNYGGERALTFNGVSWPVFVPATTIPQVTNMGSVVSIGDWGNFSEGVHARLLYPAANGAEILIPLDVRNRYDRRGGSVYIMRLRLIWKKQITGAYLQTVTLAGQNTAYETKFTLTEKSNVEFGSAAGRYATEIIAESDAAVELPLLNSWYHLVVKATGLAASGDVRIIGVEMTLCDALFRSLNLLTSEG